MALGVVNAHDHDDAGAIVNANAIEGIIVGRRSMGRNLAFADIAMNHSDHTSDSNCGSIEHNNGNSDGSSTELFGSSSTSIKVIFLRKTFLGSPSIPIDDQDQALNESFPKKSTSLPYGARVIMELGNCQKVSSNDGSGKSNDVWEVTRWKIKDHPRDLAEQSASLGTDLSMAPQQEYQQQKTYGTQQVTLGSGALSYPAYLKARGEAFDLANRLRLKEVESCHGDNNDNILGSTSSIQPEKANFASSKNLDTTNECETTTKNAEDIFNDSDLHHGGKHAKGQRARVFASWVLDTFFGTPMGAVSIGCNDDAICQPCSTENETSNKPLQNAHVLDVAGGKGQLSLELILQQISFLGSMSPQRIDEDEKKEDEKYARVLPPISQCTIIDPMVRKSDAKQRDSKLKRARSRVNWLRRQGQNQGQDSDASLSNIPSNSSSNTGAEAAICNPEPKKDMSENNSSSIKHIATCFTAQTFPQLYLESIKPDGTTSIETNPKPSNRQRLHEQHQPVPILLLGLHPDQCTEDILDMALEYNLSVAIVPCCVFPDLFPSRRIVLRKDCVEGVDSIKDTLDNELNVNRHTEATSVRSTAPVRSYDDFLQYLLDKDDGLQMVSLPFSGKNKVIYRKV